MSNDDTIDGRQYLRKDKKAQTMLRQFLNTDGPKANSSSYNRGYAFSFEFSDADRADVNYLMESQHLTFEDAFDACVDYKKNYSGRQTLPPAELRRRVHLEAANAINRYINESEYVRTADDAIIYSELSKLAEELRVSAVAPEEEP